MAKPKKSDLVLDEKLIEQAEKISPGITERITGAHKTSMKSHALRETSKKKKSENHLQPEYDLNIEASFVASLPNCIVDGKMDAERLAHLEEVLTSDSHKYDR